MATKTIGFITLDIEKSSRSVSAKAYYEGPEQPLKVFKAKTAADVVAKAKAWIESWTPAKAARSCALCRNGVELVQGPDPTYGYQIKCGACGGVVYRGPAPR